MATRPFTPAWLAGDPTARRFLPPCEAAVRRQAVERARARPVHPALLARLQPVHPAQVASRDALAAGAVCVVTGQQVGLFGGPLYTIYKAAAAIVDARALAAETGHPAVPVFWLQNEDHDFDEIAQCAVLAWDSALVSLRVEGDPGSPLRPVRARQLGPSLDAVFAQLTDALADLPHEEEVLALLRDCWTPDAAPDRAFRRWLERLFAHHGLLIVDPSDLADAAAPLHRRAIDEAGAIARCLSARCDALQGAGFPVQVYVRPDAPLSFVHPDGADGPRYRVCGPPWATPAGEPIPASVVRGGPHSTSALLRPLLQDSLLPTAAYVGGPGEITYFAQLSPLYAYLGVPMPALVHRARFQIIDAPSLRLLRQLALTPEALEDGRDALLVQIARSGEHPDPLQIRDRILSATREALDELAPHAASLDPALARAVDKTRDTVAFGVGRLVERYQRVLAERDEVAVRRLDRLLARLYPGGPQERVHAWPGWAARYGVDGLIDRVLQAVVPFDGGLKELRW